MSRKGFMNSNLAFKNGLEFCESCLNCTYKNCKYVSILTNDFSVVIVGKQRQDFQGISFESKHLFEECNCEECNYEC